MDALLIDKIKCACPWQACTWKTGGLHALTAPCCHLHNAVYRPSAQVPNLLLQAVAKAQDARAFVEKVGLPVILKAAMGVSSVHA